MPLSAPRLARAALLSSASALAMLIGPATALADCTVTAGGGTATAPASGATVTCDGPLETDGTLAPGANDVTVRTRANSGYSITGGGAVLLGANATIDVNALGQIVTSGDNARAVSIASGNVVVAGTQNGTGTVATSGNGAGAIFITGQAGVTVSGLVRTGGSDADAIQVGANSTVVINDGGLVQTGNSNSEGVISDGRGVTVVVEQGGRVQTSSTSSNPIRLYGADSVTVVEGLVQSSAGNSDAVSLTGANSFVVIKDTGEVRASSSGSNLITATGVDSSVFIASGGPVLASSSGNAAVVRIGDGGDVTVGRELRASSSGAEGIVATNNAVVNVLAGGAINATSSQATAVRLYSSNASSVNTVAIQQGGAINASGGQAIVASGPGQTNVSIRGVLTGQSGATAIVLGDGNDTLTLFPTAQVSSDGVIADGGNGSDTLNVQNGSAQLSKYINFETVNLGSMSGAAAASEGPDGPSTMAAIGPMAPAPMRMAPGAMMAAPMFNFIIDAVSPGTAINVGSGGSVAIAPGGGVGSLTTRTGSTVGAVADVRAREFAFANFGPGTSVAVFGPQSIFFTGGTASGTTFQQTFAFTPFANGGNELAVAAALDAQAANAGAGQNFAAPNAILTVDRSRVDGLFTSLSGVTYAQGTVAAMQAGMAFSELLAGRGALTAPAVASATPLGFAPLPGQAGDLPDVFRRPTLPAHALGADLPDIPQEPFAVAAPQPAIGAWIAGIANYTDFDGDARARGFETETYGGAIGIEGTLSALGGTALAGVAAGYTRSDISPDAGFGDAEVDSYHVGLYGAGVIGGLDVSGALAYAHQTYDVTRAIVVPGGFTGAVEDVDGHTFSGSLEASFDLLATSGFLVAPTATLDAAYVERDGLVEAGGGALGLTIGDVDARQVVTGIGVTVGTDLGIGSYGLRAEATVLYEHVFGDTNIDQTANFTGATVPFTVATPDVERDRLALEAGLSAALGERISAHARYEGSFAEDVRSHGGSLGISLRF